MVTKLLYLETEKETADGALDLAQALLHQLQDLQQDSSFVAEAVAGSACCDNPAPASCAASLVFSLALTVSVETAVRP